MHRPLPPNDLVPLATLIDKLFAKPLQPPAGPPLLARPGGRLRSFDPRRIGYFWAAQKRTAFYYRGRRQCIPDSLTALHRRLPGGEFVRVHRAALVNLRYLTAIRRSRSGARLLLKNRHSVPLGRRAGRTLMQRLRLRRRRRC